MTAEHLEGPGSSEERLAAARSHVFGLFAALFEYPDDEFREAIRSGAVAAALRDGLAAVYPELAQDVDSSDLEEAGGDDDLAVEFTRLFDVGPGGPPCPLYGGLYGGARMKMMEESVRFYNHFGLTLSESPRELPDHLTTQLEFLHFLAYREADALQRGQDPGPFQRAARDFLVRHPGRWVPKLRERLEGQDAMPFFRELVRLLERWTQREGSELVKRARASSDRD